MNLLVLLLIALPMCIAQFSIQGPSDGNRVAQGLTIQEGKGIQYTDQSEPINGGFTIQGAQDGHSNIQGAQDGHSNVQGASDGHTNFNIRGSTDAGAERYNFQGATTGEYNIQGATDGHSQPQPYIRGSYTGDPSIKSLEYNDPSGSRVNWRSYDRQSLPGAHQQTQYSEAVAPAPRPRQRGHPQRQPQPQTQPQPQQEIVNPLPSKSSNHLPDHIKQLLQFQAQLPYVNIIPEPFRYDALVVAQEQAQQNPQAQYQRVEQEAPEPRRPAYRGKPRGPPRHRRQAPQRRPEGGPQQNQRPSQPPAEPQYKYSTNLPPTIQQLVKFQAQTPYINVIPEQFRFNPEPAIQEQRRQVQRHYQDLLSQQPSKPVVQAATFGTASTRPRPQEQEEEHSRQRRQAPHQRPQQLPAEPRPQYSTNIPGHIQNLLKYQAQIPYNIIANQISYRPEKPYIPQPVQPSAPSQESQYQAQYQAQQAQYQPQQADYQPQQTEYQPQQAEYQPQQAQYQPQLAQYQPQQAQYQPQYQPQQAQYQPQYQTQADRYQEQSSGNQQYNSQIQYPSGYQQSGNEIRPVNENRY